MELWSIIQKGPHTFYTEVGGRKIPGSEEDLSETELEKHSKNYKAIHLLYYALNAEEFNTISSCKSAKEIWDKLVVTFEGTIQVKQTKINLLLRQNELFKMNPEESIRMFKRFTDIVNNLDSLGKTFSNEEKVRKVLGSLPKAKWEPKTTAIEEAQDLSTLELEDLQGKLLTHELQMNEYDGELPEGMKNLALKAKENKHSQENDRDDEDDDEDPFALISKALARIMKFKKNNNNYKDLKDIRRSATHRDHKGSEE